MKMRLLKADTIFKEDKPVTGIKELVFLKTGVVQVKCKDGRAFSVNEQRIIEVTSE